MRTVLLVLKHEVYMIVSRATFWVFLLGIPVFAFLFLGGKDYLSQFTGIQSMPGPVVDMEKILETEKDTRPKGYLDPGNLVRAFPPGFSAKDLIAYTDQAAATKALDAGEISAFYIISPDYERSGKLTIYMPEYNLMETFSNAEIESLINFNLLGGDMDLFARVQAPVQHIERESLASSEKAIRENNSQLALMICMAVMMLFFTGIMGSATLLLNSLSSEKTNRVIEMLMISASPMQLLVGKIAGLGLIGLAQTVIWSADMLIIMQINGQAAQLPEEMQLQPSFIGWGIVFFLLGYLLYASIIAGLGAVISDLRETSQITAFVMAPVFIPEILGPVIISNPHGTLAVIFSLFPMTAPIMVMMRMSLYEVPLWQLLASIALLALSCLVVIRIAAGLFRAQTILTGKSFSLSAILHLLRKANQKA